MPVLAKKYTVMRGTGNLIAITSTCAVLLSEPMYQSTTAAATQTNHEPSRCVQVLAKEYTAMREAGLELEGGYTPPITYITVLKRHRARLFPGEDAVNDGKGNVRPGTCVDAGVSLACGFDFYLNAHAGIQARLQYLPSLCVYVLCS